MLPTPDEIETAAKIVYSVFPPTPQYCWPLLSQRLGTEIWLKHENHTPVGAFKLRGGLVYFSDLANNSDVSTVISATRGNHGQSVALSARRHGLSAKIYVPFGNSVEKNAAMRALGAELVEYGDDFQAAREQAIATARETGAHLVPAFHQLLLRGVASCGMELLGSVPDIDCVYVPVGLGSGICAMAAARAALDLRTEIIGVVSAHARAYSASFTERRPVDSAVTTAIADGMACRTPEPAALEIIWRHVDRIVEVTDDEIAEAMRAIFECTHNCAEGAGAAPFAAALQERTRLKGRRVAVVLSGGNVDRQVFAEILAGRKPQRS